MKIKGEIKLKGWNLQTVLGSNPFNPTQLIATPDTDETLTIDETITEWDGNTWYYGATGAGEIMTREFHIDPGVGIGKAIEDFYIESVEY